MNSHHQCLGGVYLPAEPQLSRWAMQPFSQTSTFRGKVEFGQHQEVPNELREGAQWQCCRGDAFLDPRLTLTVG